MEGFIIYVLIAYIVCAIPFGVVFAKILKKDDLRTVGSGNIGATNAFRTGGMLLGTLTFLADFFKGYAFVTIASVNTNIVQTPALTIVAFICVLAHIVSFSVFPLLKRFFYLMIFKEDSGAYKLKGGKGVATALGTLLALHPSLFILALAFWTLGFLITRKSGIAAVICFATLPIASLLLTDLSFSYQAYLFALFFTIFLTHGKNIKTYRKSFKNGKLK